MKTGFFGNGVDDEPDWSPDSTKIAFQRDSEIYVVNADGSDPTNISNNPREHDSNPNWSPAGVGSSSNGDGLVTSLLPDDDAALQSVSFDPDNTQVSLVQAGELDPQDPQVAVSDDGDIYVVCEEDNDIYCSVKHAGQANFAEANERNLSSNAGNSSEAKIAAVGNDFVHVIWKDNTSGEYEILYSKSTDKGDTFNGVGSPVGVPTSLSDTPSTISNQHELAVAGSNVYVVWEDAGDGRDIYLVASNDYGETFKPKNPCPTIQALPQIQISLPLEPR